MWTASARAKINLHLAVHARRPDGFHALTTVFQTIDLADTLTVVEHDGPFVLQSEYHIIRARHGCNGFFVLLFTCRALGTRVGTIQ